LRFFFTIVISFSLRAMLPLLANKDEYIRAGKVFWGHRHADKAFFCLLRWKKCDAVGSDQIIRRIVIIVFLRRRRRLQRATITRAVR